jgi:tetratricopeptide (TPR) repeat protein
VVLAAEKARSERLQRLKTMLESRLTAPIPVIDALMAEAGEGEPQSDLWEQLHSAAARDGMEDALAEAYVKCINGTRMKRLPQEVQADVFMHAADFFQGVRGDAAAAQDYLERVLKIQPGHAEAFNRLERRLEKLLDARGLLQLYASAAASPPKPVQVLATQAFNRVMQLVGKEPLADDACKQLIALVPTNPRLLDALESHCRATKRPALACALIEQALLDETAPADLTVQRRQRLLDLYTGEAASPAAAIGHVEKLLERDPSDTNALKIAERLLSTREVASRAAAALQTARRSRLL